MVEIDTFREETRAWLADNCPEACRGKNNLMPDVVWGGRRQKFDHEDVKLWVERLAEKGWTVPTWAKEYGGAGLSKAEAAVLSEEMAAIGTRSPLFSFGMAMLAPALMEFATEEQKRRFLPPIARGEIRWCQGYSEPGAGSDLASLQCRAVRDGDHYVVNGQKIWTSDANLSDWIFCLVRTNPQAPKHEGISFLLIDMESDGVSTSPIELISGASPFCQTFFEDVKVPADQLVSKENEGWTVAKRLLQHERSMLSSSTGSSPRQNPTDAIINTAQNVFGTHDTPLPDASVRNELAQLAFDRMCYEATLQRTMDAAQAGRGMGPESSMFKLYLSELGQREADLRQRIVGTDALIWEGEDLPEREKEITRGWLYNQASTILGGTSEVQLNIISKRVLGLPD